MGSPLSILFQLWGARVRRRGSFFVEHYHTCDNFFCRGDGCLVKEREGFLPRSREHPRADLGRGLRMMMGSLFCWHCHARKLPNTGAHMYCSMWRKQSSDGLFVRQSSLNPQLYVCFPRSQHLSPGRCERLYRAARDHETRLENGANVM